MYVLRYRRGKKSGNKTHQHPGRSMVGLRFIPGPEEPAMISGDSTPEVKLPEVVNSVCIYSILCICIYIDIHIYLGI